MIARRASAWTKPLGLRWCVRFDPTAGQVHLFLRWKTQARDKQLEECKKWFDLYIEFLTSSLSQGCCVQCSVVCLNAPHRSIGRLHASPPHPADTSPARREKSGRSTDLLMVAAAPLHC